MKTHCKNNHEFTEQNTGFTSTGWRFCKKCKATSDRKYREKPENRLSQINRGKQWRANNPEKSKAAAFRVYDSIRDIIEKAKDVPCLDCGVEYPHYVMDFDHRDPGQKIMNVGATRSKAKTLLEIEKCDVVCANCHRERTWRGKTRVR